MNKLVRSLSARGLPGAIVAFILLLNLVLSMGFGGKVAAIDGEVIYGGTAASFSNVDDATDGPKNIGFTFNYYGTNYTTLYISTNGVLNMASANAAYSNNSTGLDRSIHGFWDDLILSTGSKVYYKTIGTPGSQKFVVQWTNMYFYGTSITMGTFQAVLYEGSNNIQLQYRDLLGGSRSLGDSATIGLRGSSSGSIFSYNTASISEGKALLYTPNGSGDYNAVNSSATYDPIYLQDTNAPDSPSLINPLDGTTGTTVTPTFEWQTADKATSYNILISTNSGFSSTVVNQTGITATSYTLGSALSYNTTYYWRIAAVNSYGTNLSSTRSFTTAGVPNVAPNTPASVASAKFTGGGKVNASGLAATPLTMTLSDNDSGQQVRYRIQISSDNSFVSPEIDYRSSYAAQGAASFVLGESSGTYLAGSSSTVLADGNYYVRVRAEDAAAASSAWYTVSGVAFVYDGTAPDALGKPQQVGSSVASTGSATISWDATAAADAAALPYLFDYSLVSSFSSFTTVTTAANSTTLSGLTNDTYYYVRVRVVDSTGNISTPSTALVIYIPVAPASTASTTPTTTATTTTPSTTVSTLTNILRPVGQTQPITLPPSQPATTNQKTEAIQTVVVVVMDKTGKPVEGAKVTLHSKPRVSYTDANGRATFYDVELGTHKAVVEYKDISVQQTVQLVKAETASGSLGATNEVEAEITVEIPAVAHKTISPLFAIPFVLMILILLYKRRQVKNQ